ncbi:complex I NDUFA9 subunit family protein [Candidatus Bandiella numerosa]|jgi:nucleoside-diphosphate-sugar epimerase|uniref:complex I NDUFA9 subunit family protein n=1 Tax=Candidatus Bandiella numerosa TaxID=2570586 RepID=UPI00249E9DE9|nr:complex I NDUFA9 subunit family protein [Candidatus Bandiella numerosa]WHA04762.1 complex I NDUFA9 subunit family protein [Candidatus Bandiella numerosa]
MISEKSTISIFGGNGFIGSNLVKNLAKLDSKINVIQSTFSAHDDLFLCGLPGQICTVKFCDNKAFYEDIFSNSNYVINLIGTLRENKHKSFKELHINIPKQIAHYAAKYSIKKLIHISALGIDKTHIISSYAKTKLKGESELLQNYPNATIVRPSVVFGSNDKFINELIHLITILPIFPLINKGHVFFQPIFVEDLTQAICKILLTNDESWSGKILEIGGPDKLTFLEILNYIFEKLSKKPYYLSINYSIIKWISHLSKFIKNFPITPEEVDLLLVNNTVGNKNLADTLNINLTPLKYYINKQLKSFQVDKM